MSLLQNLGSVSLYLKPSSIHPKNAASLVMYYDPEQGLDHLSTTQSVIIKYMPTADVKMEEGEGHLGIHHILKFYLCWR
jgi:hypothetical protein